jgi:hypothetical protein
VPRAGAAATAGPRIAVGRGDPTPFAGVRRSAQRSFCEMRVWLFSNLYLWWGIPDPAIEVATPRNRWWLRLR